MYYHPLDMISYLKRIRKVYKNWLSVLLSLLYKRKEIDVMVKNGIKVRLPLQGVIGIILLTKDKDFNPYLFSLKEKDLYYDGIRLILETSQSVLLSAKGWKKKNGFWYNPRLKLKFIEISYSLFEIFYLEEYNYFKVVNREVVDVGANIGDSAIFFAINGAKKVYAFEPSRYFYDIMLTHIKINRLEDKITAFNAAVSDKCGRTIFKDNDTITEVCAYSLKRILEFIEDPYLLKIDCEGCEFDIILKSREIKEFEKIIFEYHCSFLKCHKNLLIRKLEKYGFKCIEVVKHNSSTGIICCEKS